MAKERGLNKGMIESASRRFEMAVKGGEGSVRVSPEYTLVNDYEKAGMSGVKAMEAALGKLENYRDRLERQGKQGIFGVRDERLNQLRRDLETARDLESDEKYAAKIKSGEITPEYREMGGKRYAIVHKGERLEQKFVIGASIASLGAGFLFTSPNITGRVIGNVNVLDSSIIGIAFFILGLVGLFLCMERD